MEGLTIRIAVSDMDLWKFLYIINRRIDFSNPRKILDQSLLNVYTYIYFNMEKCQTEYVNKSWLQKEMFSAIPFMESFR
jgi:hypothetical protein